MQGEVTPTFLCNNPTGNILTRFIGSEIYRDSSYGAWHPLRIPRVSTVMDLSRALGWLPPETYLPSPRAKADALKIWHTQAYLEALQDAEVQQSVTAEVRKRHGLGTTANPIYAEMWRRPATAAGASLLAGELLRAGGRIYHPGGGTHHGMPDRANGFCYLNDPVLAILSLRRNGVRRIAYVDIDAHHPDGVEHAFNADPDVLMISVHEEKRWPFTGALTQRGLGQTYNLPVPRGFNDTEFHHVQERLIVPLIEKFDPDALVVQCGADAVEEDPLSRLALSNNAHWSLVYTLRDATPRLLVLGGGGYNPWSVGRLWTGVWGILSGQDIPDHLPYAAEGVLTALRWDTPTRQKSPAPHWLSTLRDPPRPGPLRSEVVERVSWLMG